MRWLKEQWKSNSNFRHAVVVVLCMGLTAAGVPPMLGSAVGSIVEAVQVQ